MTSINITYGHNETKEQFDVPVIQLMEIQAKSLEVIKGLLLSTDSNSWLIEAEQNG
jgi:hypothetical protein